jgi:replicative DNA helicase
MVMAGELGDTFPEVMDALERRAGRWGDLSGEPIKTGHADLDALTGGGWPGHLWTLGGHSGVGKTTFALGLARHTAIRQKATVRWLSTTEDVQTLVEAVLAAEARVPLHHVRLGQMTDDDWARLARQMGHLAQAPWSIAAATPSTLVEFVEALTDDPPALLVIDSVPDATDHEILAALRALTRAMGCWTLVVTDDRPGLDQIESTRAQAAAADLVIWLEREDQYDRDSPRAGEADICVMRSRYTPTSIITIAFQGHYGRFVDITPGP